jgi:hypothetical protein
MRTGLRKVIRWAVAALGLVGLSTQVVGCLAYIPAGAASEDRYYTRIQWKENFEAARKEAEVTQKPLLAGEDETTNPYSYFYYARSVVVPPGLTTLLNDDLGRFGQATFSHSSYMAMLQHCVARHTEIAEQRARWAHHPGPLGP